MSISVTYGISCLSSGPVTWVKSNLMPPHSGLESCLSLSLNCVWMCWPTNIYLRELSVNKGGNWCSSKFPRPRVICGMRNMAPIEYWWWGLFLTAMNFGEGKGLEERTVWVRRKLLSFATHKDVSLELLKLPIMKISRFCFRLLKSWR